MSVMPVNISGGFAGIFVRGVEPGGAVDVYNRMCPEGSKICAGDCIVRIGSVVMDAPKMLEVLSEANEMQLAVIRQVNLTEDEGLHGVYCPSVCEDSVPLDLSRYLSEVSTKAPSRFASSSSAFSEYAHDVAMQRFASVPDAQSMTSVKFSSEPSIGLSWSLTSAAPPPGLEGTQPTPPLGGFHGIADIVAATLQSHPGAFDQGGMSKASGLGAITLQTICSQYLDAKPKAAPATPKDARKPRVGEMPAAPMTTLMLRQLPPSFTRDMLADLLDAEGFAGAYDFIYMPMNLRSNTSFAYAFVNMTLPLEAERCRVRLSGFSRWPVPCECACVTSWADLQQGLVANIDRYRNSPVMHESVPDNYKPAIYAKGVRARFPPPTKALKAPPMNRGVSPSGSEEEEEAKAAQPHVEDSSDHQAANESATTDGTCTTLMLGQLPKDFNREKLAVLLEEAGFKV